MVDVRNREELKAWLETQPRAVGVTVAVRAALRVFPSINAMFEGYRSPITKHSRQAKYCGPVLCALAATRFLENAPNRVAKAASSAATSASARPYSYVYASAATSDTYFSASGQVAAWAAASASATSAAFASDAAASTAIAFPDYNLKHDDDGTSDSFHYFAADYAAYADHSFQMDIDDIQKLQFEVNPTSKDNNRVLRPVLARPLWHGSRIPPSIAVDWHQLSSQWGRRPPPGTASTNNWWVWTEWYQAILDGTLDEARAKLYGTVPDKLWKQGIDVVNAHIAAKLLQKDRPKPKRNLPSAYHFPVGTDGRLVAVKTTDAPVLPYPTSDADHKEQLDAAHELTRRLLALVRNPATNLVRAGAYQASLEEYAADLPPNIEGGSILLAETSIQFLRRYFELDEAMLPEAFKERLRGLLLHHQGLRVYYPSIGRRYDSIRTGRLTAPLPLDAINAVEQFVAENTPTLFDSSVGPTLTPAPIVTPVPDAPPPVAAQESRLPADPVAEVDPAKARTYSIAGTWNALYKGLLEGEKLHKAVEGWSKAANKMGEIIQSVSDIWPFK